MIEVHDRQTARAHAESLERLHTVSPRVLLIVGVVLICAAIGATFWLLAAPPGASPPVEALPSPTPSRLIGQLPAETVAVDVNFDAALGLPTQVSVGDHVDVLAFLSTQVTGSSARTVAVLKDAAVLRTAHQSSAQALTFALRPDQALVLQQLGELKAPIFLVLHPPGDVASAPSDTFTDSDLVARAAPNVP